MDGNQARSFLKQACGIEIGVPDISRETQASHSASRKKSRGAPPGMSLALAITLISAVLCWFWLALGRVSAANPATPGVSDLAEVKESEIPGALTTMVSSPALAQYREGKDGQCRQPLAWVTLVLPPGEPPSHIRLISGTYYSPTYDVSAKPMRVAIPFPAPYETGSGVLRRSMPAAPRSSPCSPPGVFRPSRAKRLALSPGPR